MKIIKGLFLSVLLLSFTSCDDDDDNQVIEETFNFTAQLSEINDSGVSGTAAISVQGNSLTVLVEAEGMTPGEPHPQHIHGLENGEENATCPPESADTNEDGIITIPEGVPFYGGVLLPLADFPVADENGTISYQQTFILGENGNPTVEDLSALQNRVIVLHGMNDGDGAYVPTTPAACGELSLQ
ncbi:hypothetical protein [Christiangramia crocea]|uniref:CHRD domain-containing protein n=1 Tax=Christiangramia crocea TaxID=2904124 RepID=A0A9X1UV82_9FLAO|nr:hypothetical protein [Gramella crocea]MCG9970761.1 hypothetical protein [Gramella crocea]